MELVKYLRVQWDRTGAVVATLLGLVVLLVGYVGTSGTEYIAEQIPYLLSGGLLAIVFLTVGAVLWLSADLRDEWREMSSQGDAIRLEQLERRSDLTAFVQQEVAKQVAASLLTKPSGGRRAAASSTAGRDNGRTDATSRP